MKVSNFLSEWMGTIFVAIYSWISIQSQLLLHWQIQTRKQSTYFFFKDKLTQEKLAFIISSLDCKMNYRNALFHGMAGGLVTACVVFLVSYLFMRKEKYKSEEEFKKIHSQDQVIPSNCLPIFSNVFSCFDCVFSPC